jgi:hypothetical protein
MGQTRPVESVAAIRSVSIRDPIRQIRDPLEPTGLARARAKKIMLDPTRFGPVPTRSIQTRPKNPCKPEKN